MSVKTMIKETKSKPENVSSDNYQVHQIIYNDGKFLIAWGRGNDQTMRIAMRWNGEPLGTQETFSNTVWFQIPETLSILMLRGILGVEFSHSEEIIKVIRDLANGEKWDMQIEKDAESGKLDFLIEEAISEKKQGILKEI
jgi:hypothetical protein